jgi:hypothetical protein
MRIPIPPERNSLKSEHQRYRRRAAEMERLRIEQASASILRSAERARPKELLGHLVECNSCDLSHKRPDPQA